MRAIAIATPVADLVGDGPHTGEVLVSGRAATYLTFDGFIVALTTPDVPRMPNGVVVAQAVSLPRGARARLQHGRLQVDRLLVDWRGEAPPWWDASVRRSPSDAGPAVARRGAAILTACGVPPVDDPDMLAASLVQGLGGAVDPGTRDGVALLLQSVRTGSAESAGEAATLLLGRGQGLTPAGDDLLAGVAATLAAHRLAAGWSDACHAAWRAAVCPPTAARRTTALAATLLSLAAAGQVAQPVRELLDLHRRRLLAPLRALHGIGHSTGNAYALSVGAASLLLGVGTRPSPRPRSVTPVRSLRVAAA